MHILIFLIGNLYEWLNWPGKEHISSQLISKPFQHCVYKSHLGHWQIFFLSWFRVPKYIKLREALPLLQSLHWLVPHCVGQYNSRPRLHFPLQLGQILLSNLLNFQELLNLQLLMLIWENVLQLLVKRKQLLFYRIYFVLKVKILIREEYHRRLFLLLNHLNMKPIYPMPMRQSIEWMEHCLGGGVSRGPWHLPFGESLYSMVSGLTRPLFARKIFELFGTHRRVEEWI